MTETKERTIGEMMQFGMDHLPEGWELRLNFVHGEVWWSLFNPEPVGQDVSGDVCTDDSCTSGTDWGAFVAYINAARKSEGMELVSEDTPID